MENATKKTVFVGLSGGVDSSVAALRLQKQGYNVVGVFIKVWHPDFLECNWEDERLDAMRVAAKLQIPFLTCDAEQAYKEYGADYVATGHYAQNVKNDGSFSLLRGIDTNKDQSYFLWTLTVEQLAMVLLPVGNSTKEVIRGEAQANNLITASKKDSQGICFLGQVDIPAFLSHYVPLVGGDVLDMDGNCIGTHKGALVYTTGQRHGFLITKQSALRTPYYVVVRDIERNTITVDTKPPVAEVQSTIKLSRVNYISFEPKVGMSIEIQTRYRQKPQLCTIVEVGNDTLILSWMEQGEQVSEGQSCVLYTGMTCLGGGIITT
jgi:tRNA-uridine 2-sulfurtransferase